MRLKMPLAALVAAFAASVQAGPLQQTFEDWQLQCDERNNCALKQHETMRDVMTGIADESKYIKVEIAPPRDGETRVTFITPATPAMRSASYVLVNYDTNTTRIPATYCTQSECMFTLPF